MNTNDLYNCLKKLDAWPYEIKGEWAHRLSFDHYIRKGYVPAPITALINEVLSGLPTFKFNPYHDELGRFTTGPGEGADDADQPDAAAPTQMVQEIPPILDPELGPEVTEPLPGMGGRPLPQNPDDLLDQGYQETSHPDAAAAGHRTFENPDTGDVLRYDEGDPDEPGYAGQDHYHRLNPNSTGKPDKYLDQNGRPVPDGHGSSHLFPTA